MNEENNDHLPTEPERRVDERPVTEAYERSDDPSSALRWAIPLVLLTVVLAAAWMMLRNREEAASGPSPASAVTGEVKDDPVIIEVNGEKIRRSTYEAAFNSFPEEMRPMLMSESGKRRIAERLVEMQLLADKAEELGLDRLPQARGQIELARGNVLAGLALEDLARNRGDVNLREFYERKKADFEVLRARQIAIAFEGGALPAREGNALPEAQAEKKAADIVARLRAGASFEQVAKEVSDDAQGASVGGQLGPIRRGMLPKDLEEKMFALQPGEVSDPIRTDEAFIIFKVEERATPPFEKIEQQLIQNKNQVVETEILDELRRSATIKLDNAFFGTTTLD